MNPAMQALQALDAAQDAFRRIPGTAPEERAHLAHQALRQLLTAPWPSVTRPGEAEQHGWLSEVRDALREIGDHPARDDVPRRAEQGLWAASKLERDLRRLLHAR